jgi:5-methyltetrahydrofolate--homocysteine methyltransferase
MSRSLSDWLSERTLLAGDGAMGTLLQAAGLPPGAAPELWNVERPDAVEAVTRAHREAGAELVLTNTFGGSPARLEENGLADRCEELNRAGVAAARRGAGEDALVLGSIGPSGKLLEPLGPLSPGDAREGFGRQARALAEAGADALCVETMSDLAEAMLALEPAVETGLPVIVSMTFDPTPNGPFTIMGNSATDCARELTAAGAAAIGSNCGTGPDVLLGFVRALREGTALPLLARPNAGLPELRGGEVYYPESPESMAGHVAALVEAGASIIGGCCGTSPEHVRAIAAEVKRLRQR